LDLVTTARLQPRRRTSPARVREYPLQQRGWGR